MISFDRVVVDGCDVLNKTEVMRLFATQGFVVLSGGSFPFGVKTSEDKLRLVESLYNLGDIEPSKVMTDIYPERLRKSGYTNIGRINKALNLRHKAFDENNSQEYHVDGIFRPTGDLNTVVMACEQQAISGGETKLFNCSAAVKQVRATWPELVELLYDPRSMRRVSDYEGNQRESTAPILMFDETYKREVVNFSVDTTVDWKYSSNLIPGLSKVTDILRKMTLGDNEYTLSFLLKTGDVLMLDNGLLAHGRNAFVDSIPHPRTMVRGKYKMMPS